MKPTAAIANAISRPVQNNKNKIRRAKTVIVNTDITHDLPVKEWRRSLRRTRHTTKQENPRKHGPIASGRFKIEET